MPYLNYAFCETCGRPCNIQIAESDTLSEYIKEGRKGAFLNDATLVWDYLIYQCPCCKAKFKYTYKDIERMVREYFFSLGEQYKEYFEQLEKEGDVTSVENLRQKKKVDVAKRVEERYSKK